MLLGHQSSTSVTNIYKILQDGYLRSSKETGITMLTGGFSNKYIFMEICQMVEKPYHFLLDSKLLLDNNFHFHLGWSDKPYNSVKVNGKKLTTTQLNKKLDSYIKRVKNNSYGGIYGLHEILLEKNVDLKKYLRKVQFYKPMTDRAPKT